MCTWFKTQQHPCKIQRIHSTWNNILCQLKLLRNYPKFLVGAVINFFIQVATFVWSKVYITHVACEWRIQLYCIHSWTLLLTWCATVVLLIYMFRCLRLLNDKFTYLLVFIHSICAFFFSGTITELRVRTLYANR